MWKDHPSTKDLEGFLQRGSSSDMAPRNVYVMRHLLADCSTCRALLTSMGWEEKRLERLLQVPSESDEPIGASAQFDYGPAFAGAERALAAFFAVGRAAEHSPASLMSELSALLVDEQMRVVSSDARFSHPDTVRFLVDCSHAARYEDPGRMLHLARLAQLAANACTPEIAGSEPRLADLRARAWGLYGNAMRVCGRLMEAEEALSAAHAYREQGTGDPPLHARLIEYTVSLHMFQRRFESAMEYAEEAGQIYRDLGESHFLASTMVQKAIASLYVDDAEGAARILNRAIPLIDHEEDPHLLLAACHNLVRCYIDLDRPEQALSLYFEARDLYQEFADTLILLRAGWQEGQLLRDLGHLHAAEAALLRARKGFMEQNLSYEAAVVSLDLAAVYVRLGLTEELRQTVSETVPIFQALRVGREALGSLAQLQQVGDQEQQALGLIRFLTARLEQISSKRVLQ